MVSSVVGEVHCDIFPQGTTALPDLFAITIAWVPADVVEWSYSENDEQIVINGIVGYIDDFAKSIVVPTDRYVVREQLVAEILASTR